MLVDECWPRLAGEMRDALVRAGEAALAEQVGVLRVVEECGCGDDFCQSFYTLPRPDGAYPYAEGRARNVVLTEPGWEGELILDVVDERIAFVEVLMRPPLD